MFHKKFFSAVLAAAIFFVLTNSQAFSASRNITSLKLDFFRTEELLSDGQQSSMSGTVVYNKNPFVFIFQIKAPVEQTMYINEEGAFLFDNDTVYEISENKDFLEQTCSDFLNWFKSDYGLSDSYFKPGDRWLEENKIVSQWDCYNFEDQPLNKVLVYSDTAGRFTRLQMYAEANTLITDTALFEFEAELGYTYPTLIVSTSYDEGSAFLETTLGFSNISFVLNQEEHNTIDTLTHEIKSLLAQYPSKDLSVASDYIIPAAPESVSYKVSIPSVITGASFKFYKKFITSQDMSNCPFYPSCSQYMLDAVSANGVLGFFQGLERLRRCTSTEHKRNQYPTLSNGKHYDPVPVKNK